MRHLSLYWVTLLCCILEYIPLRAQSLTAGAILTKTEHAYQHANKLIDNGETRQISMVNGNIITTNSYYNIAIFDEFLSYQSIIDKNVRYEAVPNSLQRHKEKKGRCQYNQLFTEHDTTHSVSYHSISNQSGVFVNESDDTLTLNHTQAILQAFQSHDNMLSHFISLRSPGVMRLPGGPTSLLQADTIFLLRDTVFRKTPCYAVQTVSGKYKSFEEWLTVDQQEDGRKNARPKNKNQSAGVTSKDSIIVSIYFIRKDNFLITRLQRKMYDKGDVVINSTMEGNPQYDYLKQ